MRAYSNGNSNNNAPSSALPYTKNGVLEKQWSYRSLISAKDGISNRRSRVSIIIRSVGCNVPGGVETLLRTSNASSSGKFSSTPTLTAIGDSEEDLYENDHDNQNLLTVNNTKAVNKLGSRLLRVAKGTTDRIERVAKGTTDRIERGMTGMAIRADQGKRPDWTCAGCYITTTSSSSNINGQEIKWEHVGNTDSVPVNNNSTGLDNDYQQRNMSRETVFHVPIVITDDVVNKNLPPAFEPVLQIQLLLRSGAGLLGLVPGNNTKKGGVGKHYIVGTANFKLAEIMNISNNQNASSPRVIAATIQSPVPTIHNTGQIFLTILPDNQFPSPNTLGYSLSDPKPEYCHPFILPFHPPLQQNYAHESKIEEVSSPVTTSTIQVGTERAIESTVVLPCAAAVTKLLADSAAVSSSHATSFMERIQRNDSIFIDPTPVLNLGHADCTASIGAFWKFSSHPQQTNLGTCRISVSLRKPKCVFEQHLGNGQVSILAWKEPQIPSQQQYNHHHLHLQPLMEQPPNVSGTALSLPFYPKVYPPSANIQTRRVGSLSFEISFEPMDDIIVGDISSTTGIGLPPSSSQIFEGVLNMDQYLNIPSNQGIVQLVHVPMYDNDNYVGLLAVQLALRAPVHVPSDQAGAVPPDLGLISLMGMKPLTEGGTVLDRCNIDTANASMDANSVKRRQQLETMGDFLSLDWLQAHTSERTKQVATLRDRYQQYIDAISNPQYNTDSNIPLSEFLLPNEKKERPAAYRPSSAKAVEIMAGIPINVHVQSVVMEKIAQPPTQPDEIAPFPDPRVYSNVTCGACADHPAGYKSGGLRRLESKREELAEKAKLAKSELIFAIHNFFRGSDVSHSTDGSTVVRQRRYVPTRNTHIAELRSTCLKIEERLAGLTWECAVRRGNVLSQGIAIALTSLLSSLSNLTFSSNRNEIYAKTELWKQHGYLLCFEGLLSATGKELGMIEDASVAIDMLNKVSVQFVPESNDGPGLLETDKTKVRVVGSHFIRWISLDRSSSGPLISEQSSTPLILRVGLDFSYYMSKLPAPLQNGSFIKFYAVLFEMGVDIRQWGANTSAQARSKIADAAAQAGASKNDASSSAASALVLDDDDDEEDFESMDRDDDILTALNMEGFRKLNLYANSVFPQPATPAGFSISGTGVAAHPLLGSLWDYIRSSAGKMQHGVIDAAAAAATNLSGGGIIFCKSGKDRTAMQVTLKQAQFLNAHYARTMSQYDQEEHRTNVYKDATLMRVYGTRLAICEKNVGQPKYAFNTLQVKFMPDMLRPPASVLAGFLKGGQVFSGKGFIES